MTRAHGSRTALRGLLVMLTLLLVGGGFGCANGEFRFTDPFDRELTLEEAQHRYTVLMRWSQFQKAKKFVAAENKAQFIDSTEALEDMRFTGHESEAVEIDSEKDSATVEVTYTLYTTALPYEVEIKEVQTWERNGLTNVWNVESQFESKTTMAAN